MRARIIFPGAIVIALLLVIQSENFFQPSDTKKVHPKDFLFPDAEDLHAW